MEFGAFAERAEAIEAADADLRTLELVAETLSAAEEEADVLARFLQGRVFPGHDGRKLAIGSTALQETIARAAGVSPAEIEGRLAETGEIGTVAASFDFRDGGQTGLGAFAGGVEPLTVREVSEAFTDIAAAEGEGSDSVRRDTLFGLFTRASPVESKFLARLVAGTMRIGVGSGTVRDAIAVAFLDAPVGTADGDGATESAAASETDAEPDATDTAQATLDTDETDGEDEPADADRPTPRAAVERALQVTNDYGRVAEIARESGIEGLRELRLTVGRPVQAMLAQTGTASEAIERWGEAAVDVKFDGARVQIHYDGTDVSIYSRRMEEVTTALPEVVEHVDRHCRGPAIIDGECVAIDEAGEPLPFQAILRRFRRKHDVSRVREEVAVELRAFDCLHAAGTDLLDAPLTERREQLEAVLAEGVADWQLTDDPAAIESMERAALADGHEGLMLKDPRSTYSPGARGQNWLKRKPDVETLDLAVVGAEWGEGRRASEFGTYVLAARVTDEADLPPVPDDPEFGEATADGVRFRPVGKVATGFTDEELAALTERVEPLVRSESGTQLRVEPRLVFEVGYEEIQQSPTYAAGYALRFPRFLGVREDLAATDADSVERVRQLAEA